jgi:hypothetical protein
MATELARRSSASSWPKSCCVGVPPIGHLWFADRQSGPQIVKFGTEEQKQRFQPGRHERDPRCAPSEWGRGMTQECALHHLSRRLWSWRSEYGTDLFWARAVGGPWSARAPTSSIPLSDIHLSDNQGRVPGAGARGVVGSTSSSPGLKLQSVWMS